MCHDRFHFWFRQLSDQRVKQHNFAKSAEAGEKRVGMPRASAAVHQLNAPGPESGSLRQIQQSIPQSALGQRGQSVEQGQDQDGRQHAQDQLNRDDRAPIPQPPPLARPCDHLQEQHQQRITQNQGQQQDFEPVKPPGSLGRGIESEFLFQPEL